MRQRRRHSLAFKQQVVGEAAVAGVSVAAVARRHGLNANMVHMWRRDPRFRQNGATESSFLSVSVEDPAPIDAVADVDRIETPEPRSSPARPIEMVLPCGVRLHVHTDTDEALLARVVRALRAAS